MTYRQVFAVEDLERRPDAGFAQVPVVLPGEVLQHGHQLRHIDVIVVVEMAEPPARKPRARRKRKGEDTAKLNPVVNEASAKTVVKKIRQQREGQKRKDTKKLKEAAN